MSLSPLVSAVSRHFERVRTGLDVGLSDSALIDELHSVRRGNWESIPATADMPYEDSQFDVVVLDESVVCPRAAREVNRILRSGGYLFFTISREGVVLSDIYKILRGGFDITDVKRESWWTCHSFHGPVTVCARKKAWKEPKSLGAAISSPFLSVVIAFLSLVSFGASAAATSAPKRPSEADAIVQLLNSRASGSYRDYASAAEVVAKAAEAGRPLQQFVLALVSQEPSAPEAARLTIRKRAEYLDASRDKIRLFAEKNNNPLAWYLLSLETGDDTLLKRAADGGNPQALNSWGTKRLIEVLRDPSLSEADRKKGCEECLAMFRKAAEQDDSNGLYNLGMCHQNGYGTDRNVNLAFDCFVKSAQMGHPEAINNLGGYYRDGVVVLRNPETAAKWFRRSADLGNSFGELNYALALQRGDGVEKDPKRAFEYFGRSASQGNADAMNAYGMCFYTGTGVSKSDTLAVLWFRNAAGQGCAAAMENLAACAKLGRGMAQDDEQSTVWMVRARAARGDANAVAWLRQNGHDR